MDIVGEDWRLSLSGYLFVMRKGMFRDHLFKCEGYAEPDVTEEDIMKSGQCGCLDLNLEEVRAVWLIGFGWLGDGLVGWLSGWLLANRSVGWLVVLANWSVG